MSVNHAGKNSRYRIGRMIYQLITNINIILNIHFNRKGYKILVGRWGTKKVEMERNISGLLNGFLFLPISS